MVQHIFDPKFKQKNHSNGPIYIFHASFQQTAVEEWSCDGCCVGGKLAPSDNDIWTMPDACEEKSVVESIIQDWYACCRSVFSSPPSLDSLLIKPITHSINKEYSIPALGPDEEDQEWILLWTVVELFFSKNMIQLVWAPTHKRRLVPRIEENFESVEIQSPEESQYRIIQNNPVITENEAQWIQEIHDLPLSDRPALRLEADLNAARERFRRRVRDARLRAKLARYRAERLAQQFLDRFGVYPDADAEEAQTEYENSSDSESG